MVLSILIPAHILQCLYEATKAAYQAVAKEGECSVCCSVEGLLVGLGAADTIVLPARCRNTIVSPTIPAIPLVITLFDCHDSPKNQ